MASTHSRAHSAPKTRQEKKKNTRRFGFNSSGAEWLEQRLLLTADLSVSKSQIAPLAGGVPAAVVAGEMVSYQITVANSNAATSSATNTTLTDTLPAGETLINASAASGGTLSVSGNSFTENLGTIGAGSTVTVTIDALVNGQVGGTLTNTASVSSPDENGGLPIVSAPVSTTINALTNSAPSLSITKTAATGDAAISAGAGETYTITVANNSANAASNVNVLDVLPAGATFLTGTVTGGTGATVLSPPTGNLETIDLGTLAGHGSATISLAITGPASVGAMINTATVESGSGNSAVASATDSVATAVQGTTTPPTGTVDLSIAKVVTASGSAGTSQTETITVKNQGTANATGVVIADMLPGGAQFISGTASVNGVAVTANNGMASAQLPTLAAGASATLTLTLTPSIVGALTDTAYVEADQVDANQANNIATATSLVTGLLTPAVDLSVTESASAATGSVGANEVYTITVTNNSANAATGVALSDTLPANALFIGATSSTGATLNPSLGTLTDQIGNLAAGASQTLTVTVTPTVAGVLTNAAYVAGSQLDTNLANNVATLTTPVQGVVNANVDLSITKTAANSNASVAVGANETYTLTVTNNGTAAATGVVISDVLPAAATFLGGSTSINGTTVADLSGTATTNLGTLAAGASATVTITVTPTVAGSITDTAYVESNDVDTNQANNSASVTTPVISPTSAANLSIAKIATPNPDVEGQPLTYVLLITNTGAAAADNVNVSDTLPSGLTFVSASTDVNGVTVNNSNGTLTANLGTVPIGAVDTITVVVTPTSPGSITNTASVSTTTPNLSTHTSASVQSTINPSTNNEANLSITKTATPDPDTVGQNLTYMLIVTNTGAAAADNVNVSDTLPSGLTFVSASTDVNGVTVNNSNGTLTANLGTVPIGAVDTITVVVTPTSPGSITNTASVSTTTPNLSTHTTASVQTTINPSTNNEANLSVIKTASPNPDTVGQNLTYVLVVTNTGAAAADNVSVSDTLPSGLTFVSGSTDVNGVTVNDNNGTLTANLGTVAAGVVETVTIVVTPTAPGLVTNTATISTTTPNASTHTSASIQTTINPATSEANVSITKTASANPGTVGQSLTYTIVATNASGAASAAGVTVVDTLPTAIGATVTAMDTTRNINLTDVGGLITDNIGSLAAGASDTITVTVTPTQAGLLTNTASVTTTTPNASNNTTASVQTTINAANNEANVSITKTASANPGTVGQSLTYTIVATNASGAASAAGVTVIDTLPTAIGATVTAVDTTRNVNLTDVAGVITDHIGTLAAGSSDTITVTVTPTQAGTLTNTASVTATTPNVSNQTSAIVNTTINPATSEANLSITKTASPSPGAINQNLTYTIVVTDAAGAASAAGVIVTDTLPTAIGAHVTAVDTTRNVNLNVTGGVITDHIGTLAAGSSDTITVTVTPTQVGTLTNTASVTTTTPNASTQTTATVNTTIASTPAQSFYLNGQPGDASDQTFLTNLYRELFDRNPDASGFQFWLNFLATNGGTTASGQSNASTRNEVVQLFLNSQEYLTHWVDSAFQAFLNRPTDHGSETFFVQQLENGVSEQSVLVTILSSPEYFSHPGPTPGQNGPGNQNGQGNQNNQGNQNENSQASNGSHGPAAGNTNLAFVDNLYVELLGRTADATSEQTWVNALNSGMLTRAQVVQGFLNTPEEAHDLLDAPGSTPGAPGTPATGTYPLAVLTGGGWDNLYFQGNLGTLNASAVDQFMGELESNTAWQTVQDQMLDLPQYFDNNAS